MRQSKNRRGLVAFWLAGAVVMTGATVGAAAPAQAVVLPPTFVQATSASNSDTSKSVTAFCPAGKVVHGAGGKITDTGDGDVVLAAAMPDVALTSVTARGEEHGIFSGNWTVTAYAICRAAPANMQLVTADSANDSVSPKTTPAVCPAGLSLYGMGFDLHNTFGEVSPDDVEPSFGLTLATVTAYENNSYGDPWYTTTAAICGDPAATMQRVSQLSALLDSSSPKTVDASCPVGTFLTGVGGRLDSMEGNGILSAVKPDNALTKAHARGVEDGLHDVDWHVSAYAVCVT
jgi:hypothetical protein